MTETIKGTTRTNVSGALIRNAVLLTVFSLACKGIGMLFRLYLSVRIGAGGYGTPSARDVGLHAFFLVRDGRLHRSGIPAGRRAARAIAGRTCRRDAQQRLPTVAGHRAGSRRTDGRGDKRRFDHAARRRAYPRAAVHTGTFPALYGSHLLSEGCVYGLPQGARAFLQFTVRADHQDLLDQCCASDCLCRTKPISAGFA